jgi:hypothetical protein
MNEGVSHLHDSDSIPKLFVAYLRRAESIMLPAAGHGHTFLRKAQALTINQFHVGSEPMAMLRNAKFGQFMQDPDWRL